MSNTKTTPSEEDRAPVVEVKVTVLGERTACELAGHLRKTGVGGMQLLLPIPLADGVPLRVEYQKCAVYGQALYSKNLSAGVYIVGFGARAHGRREDRVPVDEPASVRCLHPARRRSVKGRVVDVSKSGLGLLLKSEIAAGTEVMVKLRDRAVCGEVRHCRAVEEGYRAGMEVSEVLVREHHGRLFSRAAAILGSLKQWLVADRDPRAR